ncbi:MAG: D-alanyl-D-alanine carboxypeptidase/D-alanyl-D-alanine-endopeptidase [Pseudonocardiaceae bacterium]|nr:D-alanyl-D-alanine carboxypeptidase/D-alanyl-D-alanine-endopeptidase [Pseudonocardiaceae bacterium]
MIGERRRLPARRGARIALVAVVLLAAAGGGVGIGLGAPALLARFDPEPQIAPPPPPVMPSRELPPVNGQAPVPRPAGVAALLDPLAGQEGLGELSGQVTDPASDTVLWERDPASTRVPGSTTKLLTAGAALLALDHQDTLSTTVTAGGEPGTVVLIGGGDPTLNALPAGEESVYPGAAHLDDLVSQVQAAARGPVDRVVVDVDRYTGDVLAPGWLPADVPAGYIAPIVPVMLDGGRADPTEAVSSRDADPALAAGTELAERLGADPAATTLGAAPAGARVLGTVESAPVEDLVATALDTSDNVLGEVLAREVALAVGIEPSFSGASEAVLRVLSGSGFDIGTSRLSDGSGLSVRNEVSAALLTDVLAAAAGPDDAASRTAALRPMLTGLPVAGGTGTLVDRYETDASDDGRGWVRAKTGTLTGVNSLAGTVLTEDDRLLAFALLSTGPDPGAVRPRLDEMAAALRSCGCR